MCFKIKDRKLRVAKRDIKVYKAIAKSGYGLFYNLRDKKGNVLLWKQGYHYSEKIGGPRGNFIMRGLHSKRTRYGASKVARWYATDRRIVEMYIPKGAKYYMNRTDYVSNQLVWY